MVDIFWVWFWFLLWLSSTSFLSGRHSHYICYWWSLWNASCLPVWSLSWKGLPASCFWTWGWRHVTHAQPRGSPIEDAEWWGSETQTIRNKSLIAMAWTIQLWYYLVVRVKGPAIDHSWLWFLLPLVLMLCLPWCSSRPGNSLRYLTDIFKLNKRNTQKYAFS